MREAASQLLDDWLVRQKIKRIAYQIAEQHGPDTSLFLAGIAQNGYRLAELLASELTDIAHAPAGTLEIELDKQRPLQSDIRVSTPVAALADQSVVIVDDVLNTGRTLAYSLRPFLAVRLARLQVAVLVDRDHKLFPVATDYVGYTLATTIQDHVLVSLPEEGPFEVSLR